MSKLLLYYIHSYILYTFYSKISKKIQNPQLDNQEETSTIVKPSVIAKIYILSSKNLLKKKIPQNDSLLANPGNVDCRRKSSVEKEGRAWTRKRPHCAASGILYRSTFVNVRMTEGLARRETCGEDEGCGRGARGGGEGRIGNSNTGAIKLNNEECCRSKYEHGYDLRPRKPVHNE